MDRKARLEPPELAFVQHAGAVDTFVRTSNFPVVGLQAGPTVAEPQPPPLPGAQGVTGAPVELLERKPWYGAVRLRGPVTEAPWRKECSEVPEELDVPRGGVAFDMRMTITAENPATHPVACRLCGSRPMIVEVTSRPIGRTDVPGHIGLRLRLHARSLVAALPERWNSLHSAVS